MLEEKNRGNEFSNRDQLKVPTKKELKILTEECR